MTIFSLGGTIIQLFQRGASPPLNRSEGGDAPDAETFLEIESDNLDNSSFLGNLSYAFFLGWNDIKGAESTICKTTNSNESIIEIKNIYIGR